MITLRMLSTALLMNSQGELLMMKRSPLRTLSPGLWGAVGGHVEPHELNNPRAACEREIWEETGIESSDISKLRLQYVLLRLNQNELRQQFFYTGLTDKNPNITTNEGDLHWIAKNQALDRPMPFIFRSLLEHYFQHGETAYSWIGSAGLDAPSGQPTIHWNPLLDPFTI